MSKYRFYGDWLPCRVFARCAGENSLIDFMLQAAITHTDNETITSLEYTWKAPVTNEGDIVFKWVSNRIMSFWKICLNDVTYLNQRPRLPPPPYTFCSCIGYGTRWKNTYTLKLLLVLFDEMQWKIGLANAETTLPIYGQGVFHLYSY